MNRKSKSSKTPKCDAAIARLESISGEARSEQADRVSITPIRKPIDGLVCVDGDATGAYEPEKLSFPSWETCTQDAKDLPFTKLQVELLCRHVRNRIPPSLAATALGFSESALRQWMEIGSTNNTAGLPSPQGYLAYHLANAIVSVVANRLQCMENSEKQEWRKFAWYLERVYGDHFKQREVTKEDVRNVLQELSQEFREATPQANQLFYGHAKLALPQLREEDK